MAFHRRTIRLLSAGVLAALLTSAPAVTAHEGGITEQVSVSSTGQGGNEISRDAAISADGRFVAFVSGATNLVPGDDNGTADAFVRDRLLDSTERIPMPAGVADASAVAISGDGRFVVFAANGPEPDVSALGTHIYVHDRTAETTHQVSITPAGFLASYAPQISADGRVIAYLSMTTDGSTHYLDVLIYNRETGQTDFANRTTSGQVLSTFFDPDFAVALSGDGRVVAFTFGAVLVPGAPAGQVFVRDTFAGTTTIASTTSTGAPSPGGHYFRPAVSADGRSVAFWSQSVLVPSDTNGMPDTYVRDRVAGTIERVSLSNAGSELSQGSNLAEGPAISADGRFVAFASIDPAVVPGDTNGAFDVFVRDRQAGTTERVTVASSGAQGDDGSFGPALSADGRTVAFTSGARNLSAAKNPATSLDVYVHTHAGSALVLSAIVPSIRELWPPNGHLVNVSLAYTVTTGVGQARCEATVGSNEPAAAATGKKSADWQVIDARTVRLKAARSGGGSGRIYTITVRCVDGSGQAVTGSTMVTVPHDRRR
jgi:Tol biopolymer transport system component